MPTGVYKRGRKKAKKAGARKYTKRALPAENLVLLPAPLSTSAPPLPDGWEALHDRRELSTTVRYSVVVQVDVPEVEFDREKANELAMALGSRLESQLPCGSSLVLVATEMLEDAG